MIDDYYMMVDDVDVMIDRNYVTETMYVAMDNIYVCDNKDATKIV